MFLWVFKIHSCYWLRIRPYLSLFLVWKWKLDDRWPVDSSSSFGTIVSLFIKFLLREFPYVYYSWFVNVEPETLLLLNKLISANGFFLYITCLITCRICHVLAVRRLRWRPKRDSDDSSCLQLASCGLDHSVRIFNVANLAWLAVVLSGNLPWNYYPDIQCTAWIKLRPQCGDLNGRCGFSWRYHFLCVRVTKCLCFSWMTAIPVSNL